MDGLVDAARELAASLLDTAALAQRWAHTQGVAARAQQLAGTLNLENQELLVAAAWLHDIGYAPAVVTTGMHSIDGAAYLRRNGWPPPLVALVAHHTAARFEAAERGLINELDAFPMEPGDLVDALAAADLTVGPGGAQVTVDERIEEILQRYPPATAVHRAIRRARHTLLAQVDRVLGGERNESG